MKKLLQKLKINLRGDNVTLPEYNNVSPIVYGILAVAGGIGIINTSLTFFKVENALKQPPTSTSSQKQNIINADYSAIIKRNIFNIDGTTPDASEGNDNVCTTEPKKSSLAYKVTGIIFGGDAKSSIALLEQNSDSKQSVYKLGDTLIAGTKISDISLNRVYIKGNSCPEFLEINYPTPPPQQRSANNKGGSRAAYSESGFERVGNDTTVTKQWVNDILTNKLSSALEDARAVPYLVGGQVKGFTITQIIPDSVYSKLGLQNGDVVSNINGIELNDAARAIQTLNSLRSENKIQLSVIRGGQPVNLQVNVQQ